MTCGITQKNKGNLRQGVKIQR